MIARVVVADAGLCGTVVGVGSGFGVTVGNMAILVAVGSGVGTGAGSEPHAASASTKAASNNRPVLRKTRKINNSPEAQIDNALTHKKGWTRVMVGRPAEDPYPSTRHTRVLPSADAAANSPPSGENATPYIPFTFVAAAPMRSYGSVE